MKTIKQQFYLIGAALTAAFSVVSCSSDDELLADEVINDGNSLQVCTMELEGGIESFDGEGTRASAGWAEGDTIYMMFGSVEGKAIYNPAEGNWQLHYYGSLSNTTSSVCSAYYFDGALSSSSTQVSLSPTSVVYGTTSATYSKSGSTIKVKATLAPLTGRIRFKGTKGDSFTLLGFNYYSKYTTKGATLANARVNTTVTIGDNGYSPYYYGYFASTPRVLKVLRSNIEFKTTCESNVLATAKTGYMNVPVDAMHNGWERKEIFVPTQDKEQITVNGVSFNIIKVEGGTFNMGSTSGYSDEKPVHQVTLDTYYIGETEVTQELWYAVMGQKPTSDGSQWSSSYGLSNKRPAYYVSWNDCQEFIAELNELTGATFSLPTEAQWEFAARGGNYSNGYTYSGSNTIGDVAWYYNNSSSITHEVGTKKANELGIYDMSGNVWEWCQDWSGEYSSYSQTNPAGPTTGTRRVVRGGSWNGSNAEIFRVSLRAYDSPADRYSHLGLRLALSLL